MSSKRDLVEAHGFNRRRLVTAFVSGAPGGREVEPVRYGRAIIGGVVLAVLVVAGAAVGGFIKPRLPDGWNENGVVIAEGTGSRYIAQGENLFPFVNTASARLVVADNDTGEVKINTVPQDLLEGMTLQTTVGIVGAPDSLPEPTELINTGWTACLNSQGGFRLTVSSTDDVRPATDQARLVESIGEGAGQRFLVAGGSRYPIAPRNGDNILRELGLPGDAFQVTGAWINLLDVGPEVRPFAVPGQGDAVDTGIVGLTRVGTPVTQGGNRFLLVEQDGDPRLLAVNEFAYDVYVSGGPGAQIPPAEVAAGDLAGLDNAEPLDELDFLEEWPTTSLEPYRQTAPCLQLTGDDDFRTTALATVPDDSARLPGDGAQSVVVESGRGALVQETTGGVRSDQGGAVLVDATGTRYAVPPESRGRLGYGEVVAPAVSQAWTILFADGPALEIQDAIQPAVAAQ